MRKTYIKLKVRIENTADFVTTSLEVETGRITSLFPQYTENSVNDTTAEKISGNYQQ